MFAPVDRRETAQALHAKVRVQGARVRTQGATVRASTSASLYGVQQQHATTTMHHHHTDQIGPAQHDVTVNVTCLRAHSFSTI